MQTLQLSNIYLDWIGYLGPLITMLLNISALWFQTPYLLGYIAFLVMNSMVNKAIKNIVKEPRPTNQVDIETMHIFNLGGIKDIYGMPSGHAQSIAFSMSYLYFIQKDLYTVLLYTSILGLTVFQRWNYKKHTIKQLIVGTVIGILFGFFSYQIIKHSLEDAERDTIL